MSYRRAQLVSAAIGLLMAAAVISAGLAVWQSRGTHQDQVRSNAEIAAIARRVFNIEQPSTGQRSKSLIKALRLCATETVCVKAIRKILPVETGPRGATGPRGKTGPQGPRGISGASSKGIPGPKGDKGSQGIPGRAGDKGDTGPAGASVTVTVPPPCVPLLTRPCK